MQIAPLSFDPARSVSAGDEIQVYVLPVLLGDGIRFSSPGLARIAREPLESTRSGAVTILRFRVRK